LREFGFDVDTDDGTLSLERHPRGLAVGAPSLATATAVVVGASRSLHPMPRFGNPASRSRRGAADE
jgi:hypothetical protein